MKYAEVPAVKISKENGLLKKMIKMIFSGDMQRIGGVCEKRLNDASPRQ